LFAEGEFRWLFWARATSLLGDGIAPVALAFAVLDLTGSATDLGFVLAARTLPMVVFLLAGGVWADRIPRQRLMMISDIGRFATQGTVAALLLTGSAQIWEIVALQILNGTATAFFNPASTGLTPQTVSRERLQQANALISLVSSTLGIAGPVMAGVLVATAGPGWALAVDSATFVGSAFFLFKLKLPATVTPLIRTRFLAQLSEGWREVRSRQWVWVSILDFMAIQLFFLPSFLVLGPLIAKTSLGGASAWAAIAAASGAGAVVGDLLSFRYRPRRPLLSMVCLFTLGLPTLVVLGFEAATVIIAPAAVLFGIGNSIANTLWFTALQQGVPEQALSRVSSYDWMGSTVLRPVGYAIVGPVAAMIGVRETLIGAALATGIAQVATLLAPSIRHFTVGHSSVSMVHAAAHDSGLVELPD
jgi:MFS family permease